MIKQKETAISVKNLHKSFRLPHEQHSGIKQMIVNLFRKNRKKGYETQHVLKGLNFEIEKGDFYGIVGRNGSGKSTLLKTLAGIYNPEKGAVQINGTLVPFIELGVGFNPELTGRENVFLNGALLGFSHHEMEAMYKDIIHFAELEKFMDQKLKNYSSGMQVRLAFSIAIRANGDVLLLDEVLAVGDAAFQKKCYQYFAELKKNKKTVILVTHDMDAVQRFCNKALMIEKGEIIKVGNPAKVAQKYKELFMKEDDKGIKKQDRSVANKNVDVKIDTLKIEKRHIVLNFTVVAREKIDDAVVTVMMNSSEGNVIYRWASDDETKKSFDMAIGSKKHISMVLDNILPGGEYSIQIAIKKRDRTEMYAIFDDIEKIDISGVNQHWKIPERVKVA